MHDIAYGFVVGEGGGGGECDICTANIIITSLAVLLCECVMSFVNA